MVPLAWFKNPRVFRFLLNLWPPMVGAGISVRHVSEDWMLARVRLSFRFYNRNMVGTQFGGSLFAMTDAMYMLMLLQHIGRDHWIWDKSAEIDFLKPGKGPVFAQFTLDQNRINAIVAAAAVKQKHYELFMVDITDSEGEIIARVKRTIYVRRKPEK